MNLKNEKMASLPVGRLMLSMGIPMIVSMVFQAVGSGIGSLVISICRQMLFVFPIAIAFTPIAKNNAQMNWLLWSVFPIAEILTAVVAVIIWRKISAKKNLKFAG